MPRTHNPSNQAAKTYALDRVATGISNNKFTLMIFIQEQTV
jgi:hypothetical protein